ncbi:hypothetical protein [Psychroflexus tropicus]|uniref:hypothetical protein n=1 Tax=Psychroflexus tropicus TaxID=197345 RepID=UPI000365A785|nr:hypothetical protein [Psychroflexus tropicus]
MKAYNIFKVFFILLLITLIFGFSDSDNYHKNQKIPDYIHQLASEQNLEVVNNDMLPYINPYGSFGSNFIKGIIYTNNKVYNERGNWHLKSFNYIIFLCRKLKGNEKKIEAEFNDYEYFLVFAENDSVKLNSSSDENESYTVSNVLKTDIPVGIHLLQGNIDLELLDFETINSSEKIKISKGTKLKDSWTQPIIIPFEKGRQIITYFKNKWLINTTEDW